MSTFIDQVLAGEAELTAIDDAVSAWHASESKLTLHEVLGLTWAEYCAWVEDPEVLELILIVRRSGFRLESSDAASKAELDGMISDYLLIRSGIDVDRLRRLGIDVEAALRTVRNAQRDDS